MDKRSKRIVEKFAEEWRTGGKVAMAAHGCSDLDLIHKRSKDAARNLYEGRETITLTMLTLVLRDYLHLGFYLGYKAARKVDKWKTQTR